MIGSATYRSIHSRARWWRERVQRSTLAFFQRQVYHDQSGAGNNYAHGQQGQCSSSECTEPVCGAVSRGENYVQSVK